MRSPGGFLDSRYLALQSLQSELEPTETKLAHDSPPTTRLRTPVFDGSRAGVPSEGVELELGLVAHLSREGLVASYVEVRPSGDFVGCDAFAGLDVAEDSDFRHCFSLRSARMCVREERERRYPERV